MTERGFFERQLAFYSTYHRDRRNRLMHCVGIPMIVFSLLLLAAPWTVPVGGVSLSAAWILAIAAAAGWIAVDAIVGAAMLVALVLMALVADWIARSYGAAAATWLFAALFVVGWIFQFAGHAFEGRRPAFMDSPFQTVIGPMFIMKELLTALGVRRRAGSA